MIIIRNPSEFHNSLGNAVVTIGNFDGVHLGHREIFRRVRKAAAGINGVSVVVTFIPHPLKVLPSRKKLSLITTYAEKERLISASSIDLLVSIPFTAEFATMTASDFVRDMLLGKLGMKKLVIGYDYAFGFNREGNVTLLRRLGSELGFEVEVLDPIGDGDIVYSSSVIRKMVAEGAVADVVRLLGRNFTLDGTVIHGHHRGKEIGFPTANLETGNELVPKHGVYAVKVDVGAQRYDGACNIGSNPTFGDEKISIEVLLFEFEGDLYGKNLRLHFVERIRGEQKFPDVPSLQSAIKNDLETCRALLKNRQIIESSDNE